MRPPHVHRFRRFVLVSNGLYSLCVRVFSDHMKGWYTGYACYCGEIGYAVP